MWLLHNALPGVRFWHSTVGLVHLVAVLSWQALGPLRPPQHSATLKHRLGSLALPAVSVGCGGSGGSGHPGHVDAAELQVMAAADRTSSGVRSPHGGAAAGRGRGAPPGHHRVRRSVRSGPAVDYGNTTA